MHFGGLLCFLTDKTGRHPLGGGGGGGVVVVVYFFYFSFFPCHF